MTELFCYPSTNLLEQTYSLNMSVLNMIFIGDERRMVTDQAREEAYQLHRMDPSGTPKAHLAAPTAEPNWEP